MAQQQKTGKPWSAANPIPNIQQFVERLEKGKAERGRGIDDEQTNGQPVDHKNEPLSKKGKTVTDPTTGNQVVIEDVGRDFMKAVKNPTVRSRIAPKGHR